jgi:hypothetical protein
MMATDSEALQHSLLKPIGHKNKGVRNRIHPIQKSPSIRRPMEIVSGAFRNMSLRLNRWGWATSRPPSWRKKNSQTASFIARLTGPHTTNHLPRVTDEEERATQHTLQVITDVAMP